MDAVKSRSGAQQGSRRGRHGGGGSGRGRGGGGRGRAAAAGSRPTTAASAACTRESGTSVLVPDVLVPSQESGRGRSGRRRTRSRSGRSAGPDPGPHDGASSGRGGGGGGGRSGRGARQQQQHRQKERRPRPPDPPPQVFTSDFVVMYGKCRAAKYKVHRPGCSCSKMKATRNRLGDEGNASGPTEASHGLDGLVVLPDIRRIDAIYLCLQTDDQSFSDDPKKAERKLNDEMFPKAGSEKDGGNESFPTFKVSCAQCLLQNEPNGFVCIASPSLKTVEVARDLARTAAKEKEERGIDLHSDHAHSVCAIPRKVLWDLEVSKTTERTTAATRAVVEQMRKQGVSLRGLGTDNEDDGASTGDTFEMGNHLASLLHITRRDTDADSAYWLIMLEEETNQTSDGERKWTLDLPGGKRHLGESSLDGAIRETEEETSLIIDQTWVVGEPRKSKRPSGEGNVYYMLRPSADVMMKELEANPFWHEEGFCKEPSAGEGKRGEVHAK